MKHTFFLLVSFLFLASARADWLWKNDLVAATPEHNGYQARFTFTNNGSKPVAVAGLNFSCPCTVFDYKAAPARPGGSASLVIHLKLEGNVIPGQDLNLIVWSDSFAASKELTIHIPDEDTRGGKH
ncbi:MAG TPA: DUF1573 domain-containing protein [Chthoniobacteraceae bacterium]|jgi:hypothetical protein|nr:DUF1573 domain-containing protein [Chthoniobacteraceae bacterium]